MGRTRSIFTLDQKVWEVSLPKLNFYCYEFFAFVLQSCEYCNKNELLKPAKFFVCKFLKSNFDPLPNFNYSISQTSFWEWKRALKLHKKGIHIGSTDKMREKPQLNSVISKSQIRKMLKFGAVKSFYSLLNLFGEKYKFIIEIFLPF